MNHLGCYCTLALETPSATIMTLQNPFPVTQRQNGSTLAHINQEEIKARSLRKSKLTHLQEYFRYNITLESFHH